MKGSSLFHGLGVYFGVLPGLDCVDLDVSIGATKPQSIMPSTEAMTLHFTGALLLSVSRNVVPGLMTK